MRRRAPPPSGWRCSGAEWAPLLQPVPMRGQLAVLCHLAGGGTAQRVTTRVNSGQFNGSSKLVRQCRP